MRNKIDQDKEINTHCSSFPAKISKKCATKNVIGSHGSIRRCPLRIVKLPSNIYSTINPLQTRLLTIWDVFQ